MLNSAAPERLRVVTIALFALQLCLTSLSRAGNTFDIEDYFILRQGSFWHYTGDGQPGSTSEDDFLWQVTGTVAVGPGGSLTATKIRTTTDEPSDSRNMDEDFWYLNPATGELFFYGFRNGVADFCFPVQTIILTNPILVGGRGLMIGQTVNDTGSASVQTCLGTATANVTSSISYVEFVPMLITPLQTFTNALHMVIEINASVTIPPLPTQNFSVRNVEVWLARDFGMVMQDQDADPDDARIQAVDAGQTALADFTEGGGNSQGWVGGVPKGFGGEAILNSSGLCMDVPGLGINLVIWAGPEDYVELRPNTVYRVDQDLTTDQTMPDSIPIYFNVYDNFNAAGGGNNFGGFNWVLDVAGGASGIGRAQGRSSFHFYIAPNAVSASQWNAIAFLPANDAVNDIRILNEVIDANPSIVTDNDSGSVCVSEMRVSSIPSALLMTVNTPYSPPIMNSTHYVLNVFGSPNTTVNIDDIAAEGQFQLDTMGEVRVELGPFDPDADGVPGGQFGPLELFPVVWSSDRILKTTSLIRSLAALPSGAGSGPPEAVDSTFLTMDTATNELGAVHYTTSGAGSMAGAASPTSTAEPYECYFYTHNTTLSSVPNSNRLRPRVFFFNTPLLNGDGTGGEPVAVSSMVVDEVEISN